MDYTLQDLLDIPRLKEMLDSLDEIRGLPSAILDRQGNILMATAWQDICAKFHRINPQTEKQCQESDRHIKTKLNSQSSQVFYRCPMGLVDAAAPIIIEGQHLGSVFTGPLFLEPPDEDFFVAQAQKYGFAEEEYLQAIQKVPLFSEQDVRNNLKIIHLLVQMQAEQGFQFLQKCIAENKLRESAEKYQRIFDNLQEVYYEASLDGIILEVSPFVETLSQYSRENLIGRSLSDFYVDIQEREELLAQLSVHGQVKNYKIHLKDKGGMSRTCALTTMLVKDLQGQPVKLVGSLHDISEQEKAQEALRIQIEEYEASQKQLKESEDRFRALSDASFGGIGIHEKGVILDCNQGLSDMTGFSIDELIGMDGLKLIAPGSLDQVIQNISSGYTQRYEVEGVRKDGSIYPLSIKGKNVRYRGQEVRVIEFRDVTERKQAEEEVRKSEARHRSMLENIVDVIAIIDQQGITCFKSPNVEKWFGWKPDDLVGRSTWDIIHPDDLQSAQAVFHAILSEKNRKKTAECRYLCKDGAYRWIEYTGVNRLHDPDISGILLSYHDISERKKHENEQQKIEKLESIGVLAGGIAHDFNNILAGLYGNLSLARVRMAEDHPSYRFIKSAEESMSMATRLTSQLLTFAKGGAPAKENLSLNHLVDEVVHFNLSGSNIRPVISQAESLWMIKADQGQIQQVFGNLTLNAKQAMPNGGQLEIQMENVVVGADEIAGLAAGRYLRVQVTDEGVGISPEHLPRIFDPYFTTKQAGSGLGLATIYSIVNRHNGHISVESEVGKGTTFTLYLPAVESQKSLTEQAEENLVGLPDTAKILVMDDEPVIRTTISEMLADLNCQAEAVEDGHQAVECYRQALASDTPFDLVILDLTIPGGLGGQETAAKILELDPLARLIVSSGYADDPVLANCQDYGFKDVVTKPCNLMTLATVLSRVLDS